MNSNINNLVDRVSRNQGLFSVKDSVVIENDTTGFLQYNHIVDLTPIQHSIDEGQVLSLFLLGLVFIVGAIWYFAPSLLQNSFSPIYKNPFGRFKESATGKTGAFTSIVLYLNFFVTASLLVFIINNSGAFVELGNPFGCYPLYYISSLFVVLFLYRYVFIALSGFVFNTYNAAFQQNRFYNSVDKALGLLFLPLLLFALYTGRDMFLYMAFVIVAPLVLMRWIFTFSIGIRTTNFSWFHFILYLCALEIVPLMLLLKVLQNRVF
jgi:hypothetical protein